ncbi:hypothetical protein ACWCPQ_05610 [Nocardia sp. NPDC001965]
MTTRYGGIRPGFTELTRGTGELLVVAVDFDLTSRDEAGFRDLAQLLPAAVTVWLTAQPPATVTATVSGEAYAVWWADRLAAAGADVGAILGYCAGGVFASALADEVARRQGHRPATVLLNPGRPTSGSVLRDIRNSLSALTSLTVAERDDLIDQADVLLRQWPQDVAGTLDRVLTLYREAAYTAFERVGIAPDVGAELIDVFASYTAYLRAASALAARPQWSAATTLSSVDDDADPDFTAHRVPTAVPRRDLLRSPEIAHLVTTAIRPGRKS